jgi:hypothetical protein
MNQFCPATKSKPCLSCMAANRNCVLFAKRAVQTYNSDQTTHHNQTPSFAAKSDKVSSGGSLVTRTLTFTLDEVTVKTVHSGTRLYVRRKLSCNEKFQPSSGCTITQVYLTGLPFTICMYFKECFTT